MKKRIKIPKRHSKKLFSRTAKYSHKKNTPRTTPMRGGIRL